jgi:hypothetical protein
MKKLGELFSGAARSRAADSEPLDALFRGARSDGLTSAETEALWNRVGVAVGFPGPSGSTGSAVGSAAAATSGGILKVAAAWVVAGSLVMGGAGLATVGVAARALRLSMQQPMQPAQSMPEAAPDVSRASPGAALPVRSLEVGVPAAVPPSVTEPGPDVARGRDATSAASHSQKATVGAVGRTDAPSRSTAASRPESEATSANADPGIEPRSGLAAPPAIAAGPQQAGTSASPSQPGAGEGALLLRARQVLTSDPAAALALTQQHARRFPTGTLVPEREVLAIEALNELGRVSEARSRFDTFRARYPQSPHLARLQALLGR